MTTSTTCHECRKALIGRVRVWRCVGADCPAHRPAFCAACTVAHDWTCPACGVEMARRPHRTAPHPATTVVTLGG